MVWAKYFAELLLLISPKICYLSKAGLKLDDIMIITPYRKQKKFLQDMESEDTTSTATTDPCTTVEVLTIDQCQGRESACVIISLVRSNPSVHVSCSMFVTILSLIFSAVWKTVIRLEENQCCPNQSKTKAYFGWFTNYTLSRTSSSWTYKAHRTTRRDCRHTSSWAKLNVFLVFLIVMVMHIDKNYSEPKYSV